jgi:dTDP-4-dehydrorhamnose reductase
VRCSATAPSATYIDDCARATLALLERRSESGLYHCVNSGAATWHAVGLEAARQLGVTPNFEVVSVADVKLPASRPQYCALSNAKLNAAIGYEMPTWQDALAILIADCELLIAISISSTYQQSAMVAATSSPPRGSR